jgi:hypothetical protein
MIREAALSERSESKGYTIFRVYILATSNIPPLQRPLRIYASVFCQGASMGVTADIFQPGRAFSSL